MAYSNGYPVRLVGGRLALDFINTADWSLDDQVIHEKLETLADLKTWLKAMKLETDDSDLDELITFRFKLRKLVKNGQNQEMLNVIKELHYGSAKPPKPKLKGLLAASAISILTDHREHGRMKMCPAENCGWLFVDETKNSRRTWCSMETCGNRAKAARHYERRKKSQHT